MQIISIAQMPRRVPARPRLLLAKASTIWLWPGIPLTELRGGAVRPIPPDAIRFWLSKLMGPEVTGQAVPAHVARAAEHLSAGDEAAAQHCLDWAAADTLSPEGAMLAKAVAARLGIGVPDMPIAKRMPLWDRRFVSSLAPVFDRFAEAADWLDKAGRWDERWSAGSTEGKPGAFRPGNGRALLPSVPSAPHPDPDRPGIGHNGGPPLVDDVPDVPLDDPGPSHRWPIIKTLARWTAKRAAIMAGEDLVGGPVGLALNLAQIALWVHDYYPYIRAYNDPPKPLADLERAAQGPARTGYDVHHIVWRESGSDKLKEVSPDKIEAPENLVSIPTLKHWELNSWYQTKNENFRDLHGNKIAPRDYLIGKGYDERRRVGLMGLRTVGVLK